MLGDDPLKDFGVWRRIFHDARGSVRCFMRLPKGIGIEENGF
jgi:hypothetical protein